MEGHERDLYLASRHRTPHDQVVRYMENNAVVPGQPLPVVSQLTGEMVLPDEAKRHDEQRQAIWQEADEEKEKLFRLMQDSQKKLNGDKDGDGFKDMSDLRKCSWAEVMKEIDRMSRRWKNNKKEGKAMVLIDNIGRHSSALDTWLDLLPSGDYGSSICGVFKLVIGAARQYSKAEETILEALLAVPRILDDAKRYMEMFQTYEGRCLAERTVELFRAILKLLQDVMGFFTEGACKGLLKSLGKQNSYSAGISDNLKEVEKRARIVNEEAQRSLARVMVGIDRKTNIIADQVEVIWLCFGKAFEDSQRSSEEVLAELKALKNRPDREGLTRYDLANVDRAVLLDNGTTPRTPSPSLEPRGTANQVSVTTIGASTGNIDAARILVLRLLKFDPAEPQHDITSSLNDGARMSNKAKARAVAMIQSAQFSDFMNQARRSDRLLVNGRDEIATSDGVSSVRVVAAQLARRTAPSSCPIFVVSYFCAAHPRSAALDRNALKDSSSISMMVSLVGQLLGHLADRGISPDLSFITEKWDKLEKLRPRVLCALFSALFQQTPPGSALLCIIDEISLYEIPSLLRGETELVMNKLVRLASREGAERQVFKLLVTCQTRAMDESKNFKDHCLDLPEHVELCDWADKTISNVSP